jgi:hypothetical protein
MVGRTLRAFVLALAVVWGVAPATIADQAGHDAVAHPCQGLLNAYAHAAEPAIDSLRAVADAHGCDLSGVERVEKHGQGPVGADSENTETLDVAAKCDRIAQKLFVAEARPHGKSADAFRRQAARWGCESS